MSPSKIHIEVLNAIPQNVNRFADRVFLRGDYVKIRSLRWVQNQYNQCPYEKRNFEHSHPQREDNVKTQGQDGHQCTKKRGLDTCIPQGLQKESDPVEVSISDF